MKPVKKIALLHDICGVGKAALTNMFPILSVMGVEPCPVPTVLLSSHTGGYGTPAKEMISPDYVRQCADHYKEQQVTFDMIFIGYLGNTEMADAVQYFLEAFPDTLAILDPIMGDHGTYYCNFDRSYGRALRKLLPYADLILPNLTECYLLLDRPFTIPKSIEDIQALCYDLGQLGANDLIITSAPFDNAPKGIAILDSGDFSMISVKENLADFHGTGDVFDGMLICGMLSGKSLAESAKAAHAFVCDCIRESCRYDYPKREGLLIEKTLKNLYK